MTGPREDTRIDAATFAAATQRVIERFIETQSGAIRQVADLVVESLGKGGMVQVFGTGHSEAFVMEMVNRAGGLVAANGLSLRDVAVATSGSGAPGGDPSVERAPDGAAAILEGARPHPADLFLIASQSGINGVIVEMARLVKSRGHRLVAITSLEHSRAMASRHPSGLRLFELADVTIDNCAPYGDGLMPLPTAGAVGSVSSITAAIAAQMIVVEVVGKLLAQGREPEIYLSANIDGGDDHNRVLEARYAGRKRTTVAW